MPRLRLLVLAALLLAGCRETPPVPAPPPAAAPAVEPAPPPPVLVGADRDAHGCITSAGYAWCARSDRCERPWELAAQKGVENSAEAFAAWCAGRD